MSKDKLMTRNEEIKKAYEDRDDIKDYSLAEYGFKEGADWQKQVLMQYAVDGLVRNGISGQYLDCDETQLAKALGRYNADDKVKILIVKDNE